MVKIKKISARKILDSRGEWTISVRLELDNKISATASVPQGKSSGISEASFVSADKAVSHINTKISKLLFNSDPSSQYLIDQKLIKADNTKNKRKLGANAILGASLACARVCAKNAKIELWEHFQALLDHKIGLKSRPPRLFINLINGGAHAGNNLDFQEYLVIPKQTGLPKQIEIGLKIYQALHNYLSVNYGSRSTGLGDEGGFAPDLKNNLEPFFILKKIITKLDLSDKVDLGIDAAASGIKISKDKLTRLYDEMIAKYRLLYIEDPYDEKDFSSFSRMRQKYGSKTWITGDDLTTTNVELMAEAKKREAINAIIIKPNQIGTVTETINAINKARKFGWAVIVSHRSGETNDDFIADLAYGVGADGFKLGAPARGERIAKYNRLLEISSR